MTGSEPMAPLGGGAPAAPDLPGGQPLREPSAAFDGFPLRALALPGIGEVHDGDDLGAVVVDAARRAGLALRDDDVLVVASKVVAKAEGRTVRAETRAAAVDAETVRVVAERTLPGGRTTRVVQSRTGPVLAAAGVDASDVEPGTVLLLPADPDASARALRARIGELTGTRPAVVISDTAGRPWRVGVSDMALGAAGITALDDVRGRTDRFGRPLEVTVRAVADEVAALADLVKGKAAGTPVALVRGLAGADGSAAEVGGADGDGAAACTRTGPSDWFALGHVEAVRAALGVAPGDVASPPVDPALDSPRERLGRALAVARGGSAPEGAAVEQTDELRAEGAPLPPLRVTGAPAACGVLAERLRCALWAEGLAAEVDLEVPDGVLVRVVGDVVL